MEWQPYTLQQAKSVLDPSLPWFLDGGEAIDWYLGQQTRQHDDLDIGITNMHALQLLNHLVSQDLQVFNASKGQFTTFEQDDIAKGAYNFWVSDREAYRLQILVYYVQGGLALFRRNKQITWPVESLAVHVRGEKILNPTISLMFKVTSSHLKTKDLSDIQHLIASLSSTKL